jgi:hypothetical protein
MQTSIYVLEGTASLSVTRTGRGSTDPKYLRNTGADDGQSLKENSTQYDALSPETLNFRNKVVELLHKRTVTEEN